jgi:AcrR family transcriptional regulator
MLVDTILEATARVLKTEGYAGASTNRIAKVAGVSVGSLYQYFPNKDALVLALASAHADAMMDQLSHALLTLGAKPVAVAVPAYVRAMIDAHRVDPELHIALTPVAIGKGLDDVLALQGRARFLVRGWLKLHADDVLPRDHDAAAFLLVTTVEAVIHGAILDDPKRLEDRALERELVSMLLRYLTGSDAAQPA